MKTKFTQSEKNWILYDVGNSAFTLLATTIVPIYFNALATNAGVSDVNYLANWGYAASLTTLIVAISGPIVGTLSDHKGRKKRIFSLALIIGALACVLMGLAKQWIAFMIIFVIAKIFYQVTLILYDSMLSDVTTEERMDNVSSQGYAWGYIGSCIPFITSLVLILGGTKAGLSMGVAMMISFIITAVWWVACSMPLLKTYRQVHYVESRQKHVFSELKSTFGKILKHKKILFFLIAFFFYIDGVYTIIDMATAYGSTLGLNSTHLLLALLVTQFVAFPSALFIGRLSRDVPAEKIISVCIIAYLLIALYAIFLKHAWQFWVLAISVGLFQGGIQALSRSYYTKIIPANQSGEFFGIMDIIGKGASFTGTAVVSLMSQLTHSVNLGVGSIALFFVIGFIMFRMSAKTTL